MGNENRDKTPTLTRTGRDQAARPVAPVGPETPRPSSASSFADDAPSVTSIFPTPAQSSVDPSRWAGLARLSGFADSTAASRSSGFRGASRRMPRRTPGPFQLGSSTYSEGSEKPAPGRHRDPGRTCLHTHRFPPKLARSWPPFRAIRCRARAPHGVGHVQTRLTGVGPDYIYWPPDELKRSP